MRKGLAELQRDSGRNAELTVEDVREVHAWHAKVLRESGDSHVAHACAKDASRVGRVEHRHGNTPFSDSPGNRQPRHLCQRTARLSPAHQIVITSFSLARKSSSMRLISASV